MKRYRVKVLEHAPQADAVWKYVYDTDVSADSILAALLKAALKLFSKEGKDG